MKKCLIAMLLAMPVTVVWSASDPQTELAVNLQKMGIILIHNDLPRFVEVAESVVGKRILCISRDYSKQSIRRVTSDMFPKDGHTILVWCNWRNGQFTITKGFV